VDSHPQRPWGNKCCSSYFCVSKLFIDSNKLLKTRVVAINLSIGSGAVINTNTVAVTGDTRAVDSVVSADGLGIRTHLLARTAAHLVLGVVGIGAHNVLSVVLKELGVLITGLDAVLLTD